MNGSKQTARWRKSLGLPTLSSTAWPRTGAVLLIASVLGQASAVEPASDDVRFFESRVRPLLVQKCYECHSGDANEGGLRLDHADSISHGGDSGPAVVGGDLDASLLIAAIRYEGLEMPPDEPLSDAEKNDLETWVRRGAVWPITGTGNPDQSAADSDASWWAAQPLADQSPTFANSSSEISAADISPTRIDAYLDAKLRDNGLHRSPPADRETLIRRLSFDLTGLPPAPDAVRRFVQDDRHDAYARLVDSMFADPDYGVRMARLWLDLVRYAESDGWRADAYRPQAYRYRDFVVDAFNAKLPYDQFVQMQIAGDEMPSDSIDLAGDSTRTRDTALAAVGFLRLGIYEYNQRDSEGQWQNIVDELTDVTADVFLATGLACAKCHDHKFDPIPRSDYFRFRSVFEPILFVDRMPTTLSHADSPSSEVVDGLLAELKEVEGTGIQELSDFAIDRFPLEVQAAYRKPADQRNSYEHQLAYLVARQVIDEGLRDNKIQSKLGKERYQRRKELLKELDTFGANPYATPDLMTVCDASGSIRPTRLPGRTQGREFTPGVPEIFGGQDLDVEAPLDAPESSGRRLALARWITDKENPITPRVMVNRLWQYHFDQGLVTTPNDFGRLGVTPSHPALLDDLASRFVKSGWSIQTIQREIVMSAAYQQSAGHPNPEAGLRVDPENHLIWRRTVRRLDAEQYRDALLVAMDSLIDHIGGPGPSGTEGRRSIYLRRFRNKSDEMLASLDAPPGVVGMARRDVTTTAPQSLMMLNNHRIIGVAKKFADRVHAEVQSVAPEDRSLAFVQLAHQILAGSDAPDAVAELMVPLVESGQQGRIDVCHVLINSNAFLFIE